MIARPKWFLVVSLWVLLSLALVACARERPPLTVTPGAATPAARSTVAPSPTPPPLVTEAALSGAAGAASGQVTPVEPAAGTPTSPTAQQVIISPSAPGPGGVEGEVFIYTVQAGDTLAQIAQRFRVTQEAIAQLNGLADPNVLTVGQQLKIPSSASADIGTPATTTATTSIYVVQAGDTLNAIARRFNTTVAELMRLNNLTNLDRIVVGQQLVVPAADSTVPSPGVAPSIGTEHRTHVVQKGETLLSIARRYGVTVQEIQKANNITNPDLIFPGQVLVIP
ncbi:MAG: LysM peptidoglycan-binding domain-containing protein [Anaerolineae bacterium]